MYRDFLAAGHVGMQHWSSWPENYDEIYQRALATGYTVGHDPGTVIEMADATPATINCGLLPSKATGSNPIRVAHTCHRTHCQNSWEAC